MNSLRLCQGSVLLASLLSTFALLPSASIAQSQFPAAEETVTEVVRYGDLNIHSEMGRKTLLKRINLAVNRVCAESSYPRGLRQREFRSCQREKLDDALTRVDQTLSSEATVVVEPPQTRNDTRQPPVGTLNHKGVFIPTR